MEWFPPSGDALLQTHLSLWLIGWCTLINVLNSTKLGYVTKTSSRCWGVIKWSRDKNIKQKHHFTWNVDWILNRCQLQGLRSSNRMSNMQIYSWLTLFLEIIMQSLWNVILHLPQKKKHWSVQPQNTLWKLAKFYIILFAFISVHLPHVADEIQELNKNISSLIYIEIL